MIVLEQDTVNFLKFERRRLIEENHVPQIQFMHLNNTFCCFLDIIVWNKQTKWTNLRILLTVIHEIVKRSFVDKLILLLEFKLKKGRIYFN